MDPPRSFVRRPVPAMLETIETLLLCVILLFYEEEL